MTLTVCSAYVLHMALFICSSWFIPMALSTCSSWFLHKSLDGHTEQVFSRKTTVSIPLKSKYSFHLRAGKQLHERHSTNIMGAATTLLLDLSQRAEYSGNWPNDQPGSTDNPHYRQFVSVPDFVFYISCFVLWSTLFDGIRFSSSKLSFWIQYCDHRGVFVCERRWAGVYRFCHLFKYRGYLLLWQIFAQIVLWFHVTHIQTHTESVEPAKSDRWRILCMWSLICEERCVCEVWSQSWSRALTTGQMTNPLCDYTLPSPTSGRIWVLTVFPSWPHPSCRNAHKGRRSCTEGDVLAS